ncbi:toprim domain-containing protein [Rhizobium sp. 12,4]|uniref:toprim domain-containing protein n=1 Tax=Rhizobium sp. 12,4 TaxID=3405135 RepID=UPI003D32B9E2
MMHHDDTAIIKQGLKDRIEDLCRRLLPDGRRNGRLWVANNPITMDAPKSPEFKVALDRDHGAWKDWRTGEVGDVIKLVEYVLRLDFRDALAWSRDFLGMREMSREQLQAMQRRTVTAKKESDDKAEENRLKRLAKAARMFEAGLMDGAGSSAEAYARAYFAARKIPLERIANRDLATFRFSAETEFWPRAKWDNSNGRRIKTSAGPGYPCIHSAMRVATGQLTAVHLTFLSPLGPRKLPVKDDENAKLMYGEAKGAVIRISHGPEGEPPETALQAHPVIIGEGIETTASVAMEAPEARAWAAGSLSNMGNAPLWLPCISAAIILKDHFKSRATEKQFDQVLEQLSQHGKPLSVIASIEGNDFNDLAQGEE